MTTEELKEWMDERFNSIQDDIRKINGRVYNHDKWLWYLRGAGAIILLLLGYLGLIK